MKAKKVTAILLAAAMVLGLTACSNQGGDTASSKGAAADEKSYEQIVYAYASMNNIPSTDTLATVEEEINKITREKIGAEIKLMPLNISEYSSKVSLALQGGDQIDVFESVGDFNVSVSGGMAYDLTNIIDSCAPETKELLGEDILSASTKDGKLYGIPTYKPYALTQMVIYKKEIAEELGIDMSKVKSIYDLTDVLRTVKKAHPDMTPLVPVSTGSSGISLCMEKVDYLTDDYNSPKGILQGDELTVVDSFQTKDFADLCNLSRTWYNEGLILKDAATTTSTATELMSGTSSFCYVASYSYPTEDTAASLESQCAGVKLGAVQIGDAYLDTTSINALSWMVSSKSKAPEAALKFINLTFTDKDIVNLLIYGIKDRDYVLDENGYMSYPEGQDASSVPYTAQLSCGVLGNYFIMHPMAGTSKESLAWEEEQNQKAAKSPAMGFTFDSSKVKTEYTSVANINSQYLPGLLCGSVDPEVILPEMQEKLKAAGIDTIIKAKQEQLDAWAASK